MMKDYRARLRQATSSDIPETQSLLQNPALIGDHSLNALIPIDTDLRAAAVLVPIIERPEGPTMLFTVRAAHLPKHSGQVAFPGGKVEDIDSGPAAAALRETYEEIGINPSLVSVAGCIDVYQTVTAFRVLPILGFVTPNFELNVDANEVADVFEVPLDFILDPRNHRVETRQFQGHERRFYAMDYNGYFIWGATAGMIRNLTDRLEQ
jgi:8-oxo-dGTP pyrophosphatase MutT (NUDIX family)